MSEKKKMVSELYQKIDSNNQEMQNNAHIDGISTKATFEYKDVKWENVISILAVHCLAIYLVLTFPFHHHILLSLWTILIVLFSGWGVTAGAHRLWTHRSYKANAGVRIFLMICYTMSGQNSLYDWVRDHRVHHKYSETNADPHNSNRGFFFAHCGWLMLKKHSEVINKGRQINMSDIKSDPVIDFHERYFLPLKIFLCFIMPVLIPILFLNESIMPAFMINMIRYVFVLNCTWLVNSAAHLWGNRPYDKNINPAENSFVSLFSLGEGWHNYHHVFPWDYRTAEIGINSATTTLIEFFAKVGWAWDLKQPTKELVEKIAVRNGDGSWSLTNTKEE